MVGWSTGTRMVPVDVAVAHRRPRYVARWSMVGVPGWSGLNRRQSTVLAAGRRDALLPIFSPMRKLTHSFWLISHARAAGRRGSACRWRPQKMGWSPARPARSKSKGALKRRIERATRRRRISPISTGSVCRRNAASPRPRKAISSPSMSNGRRRLAVEIGEEIWG